MSGPDRNEDLIHNFATAAFAVLVLLALAVLLSGNGLTMPSTPRVPTNGVTTTTGDAPRLNNPTVSKGNP